MADGPSIPRTRTGRRIVLVVPENAAPSVLAFVNEVKSLLDKAFVVRMQTDEEVTPVESAVRDIPFVVKVIG